MKEGIPQYRILVCPPNCESTFPYSRETPDFETDRTFLNGAGTPGVAMGGLELFIGTWTPPPPPPPPPPPTPEMIWRECEEEECGTEGKARRGGSGGTRRLEDEDDPLLRGAEEKEEDEEEKEEGHCSSLRKVLG